MRVALFTNNYLPFRGGVTTAVETLRTGLEAGGHQAWVFAPGARETADPPFVFRYPAIPAPTYPGFAVPVPISPRLARLARDFRPDVIHVPHPCLLGLTGRRPPPPAPRLPPRRPPRPAPVPPRPDGPAPRPAPRRPAGLHLSHALREVRP